MWSAMTISGSGLAASAQALATAAGKVAQAFTGGPAPTVPPSQPAKAVPPAAAPVATPPGGASAVAAQEAEPVSWMVEVLNARAAYSANVATMKAAEQMSRETIDTLA